MGAFPTRPAHTTRGAIGLATYSGATALFTPAATATDIFTIGGSASRIIRVIGITFSGTQTSGAAINNLALVKRNLADTAGTPVTTTAVPHDSASPAATAIVRHFTANPTINGTVGTMRQTRGFLAAAASVASGIVTDWSIDLLNGQPVVLRGVAECLAINLGGAALPAGAAEFQVSLIWTEEGANG